MSSLTDVPSIFFIAEAGVNHDGLFKQALAMVDAAAEAGASAIKFQVYQADQLTSVKADRDWLRTRELTYPELREISDYCTGRIEFMATPFTAWAVDWLAELGVQRIKVASGDITNWPLLRQINQLRLPVLLSTGGALFWEIAQAMQVLQDCPHITLMHSQPMYPTPLDKTGLLRMHRLASMGAHSLGLSDHTKANPYTIPMAIAMGATAIEKHFTLTPDAPMPDHPMSLSPAQLADALLLAREAASCLPVSSIPEALYRRAQRSWYAAKDLPAGHVLREGDLVPKRPWVENLSMVRPGMTLRWVVARNQLVTSELIKE